MPTQPSGLPGYVTAISKPAIRPFSSQIFPAQSPISPSTALSRSGSSPLAHLAGSTPGVSLISSHLDGLSDLPPFQALPEMKAQLTATVLCPPLHGERPG